MNISNFTAELDPGELWVLNYVRENTAVDDSIVVFDVGANKGLYSMEVLRYFGDRVKLFCFEPSLPTFKELKKTLSRFNNAECLNFGFSDSHNTATLYLYANQSGLSSVYDRFRFNPMSTDCIGPTGGEEMIGLTTVDSFCTERGIEKVGLLKLDVEGHELKVLHGAKRLIGANAIDFIQFEFGGTNIDSKTFLHDFIEVLSNDFRFYRILKDGLVSIEPYQERYEIFLYTNYLAVSKRLGDPL